MVRSGPGGPAVRAGTRAPGLARECVRAARLAPPLDERFRMLHPWLRHKPQDEYSDVYGSRDQISGSDRCHASLQARCANI